MIQQDIVMLKGFAKAKSWNKLTAEEKALIKNGCISSVQNEQEKLGIALFSAG